MGKLIQTKRGEIWTGYKEDVFYSKGCEALTQVAQRGGGLPTPAGIQGWMGH